MGGVSWSAAAVEAECRMSVAMWDVAARCTMPSRMISTPLPRSSRTRVDADMIRLRMTKRITSRLTRNRLHLAAYPSSASILITALALAARTESSRLRCLRSLRFGDLEAWQRLEERRVEGQIGFVGKIADGKIGFPILGEIHLNRLVRGRIDQQDNFPPAAFYGERVAILLLDLP